MVEELSTLSDGNEAKNELKDFVKYDHDATKLRQINRGEM
jgi:hypothetical protein